MIAWGSHLIHIQALSIRRLLYTRYTGEAWIFRGSGMHEFQHLWMPDYSWLCPQAQIWLGPEAFWSPATHFYSHPLPGFRVSAKTWKFAPGFILKFRDAASPQNPQILAITDFCIHYGSRNGTPVDNVGPLYLFLHHSLQSSELLNWSLFLKFPIQALVLPTPIHCPSLSVMCCEVQSWGGSVRGPKCMMVTSWYQLPG